MSGSAVIVPARPASKAAVLGYVEALNDQAAIGWVWCPGYAHRLNVELRLAEEVVAHAVADENRDDLARGGIGDGRHAFRLAVPEEIRGRVSELRVFASPIEGPPVALEPPPPAPALAGGDMMLPLQRGIETLISSQRLLHRNLQAALLQQGPSAAATFAEVASAQLRLGEALATVELFVVRLEAALQNRDPTAAPPRRLLALAVGLSGLAFLTSCWTVYRVVLGSW